jgi:hypothetical protein
MNHHPLAVNIVDLEPCHLGAACTGGIESHQQDPMEGGLCGINQTRHFILAEHRSRSLESIDSRS